jgi:transposase
LGHDCAVVAPSLIPQRPGDRVKTNRRDALSLAKLHRAGELTPVWVPDVGHEAIRELVRAREGAMEALRRARQQLLSFLLRHGRVYTGRTPWSKSPTRNSKANEINQILCRLKAMIHGAIELQLPGIRQESLARA